MPMQDKNPRRNALTDALFDAILSLQDREECYQFFDDLCTVKEIADMSQRLEAAKLPVVFHVHDEVVIDVAPFADEDTMLSTVCSIMGEPVPWAPDLPLKAAGWVGYYFTKD